MVNVIRIHSNMLALPYSAAKWNQKLKQTIEGDQNNSQRQAYYQNKDIEDLIESNWISIEDNEIRMLQFIREKSEVVDFIKQK